MLLANTLAKAIAVLPLLFSIDQVTPTQPQLHRDLPEILDEGVLRVGMSPGPSSWYLAHGEPRGFEYELLVSRRTRPWPQAGGAPDRRRRGCRAVAARR